MRRYDVLFASEDLDERLRQFLGASEEDVKDIPADQFAVSSNDALVNHLYERRRLDPLVLHEGSASSEEEETEIDVSGYPGRVIRDPSQPFFVPGTKVDVMIPFTGQAWLFQCRPSTWRSTHPHGIVLPERGNNPGTLVISISLPHDVDKQKLRATYDQEIGSIRFYVQHVCSDIEKFNKSLKERLESAVSARRQRRERHSDLSSVIGIPLRQREGAPTIKPVTIEVRKIPPLPSAPKNDSGSEPGITDKAYAEILHFIRHQGRTFERTPGTYAVHGEEDLRNIILGQLNGRFVGQASGEAFRVNGKTDICIDENGRAAFIGECKVWEGAKAASSAVGQLLSYLTWRDCKTALIFFNKRNKSFSKILTELPTAFREHALFVSDEGYEEGGEWQFLMKSANDEDRRVRVHVFLFNLFTDK